MSDTRQMRRQKAKLEYKKMIKNRAITKAITFPTFFKFFESNADAFKTAESLAAKIKERAAKTDLKEAIDVTDDMIVDFEDFDDEEDGVIDFDAIDAESSDIQDKSL